MTPLTKPGNTGRLTIEDLFSFGQAEFERPEVHPHGNIQKVFEKRDMELKREVRTRDVDLRYLHRSDS